MEVAAWACKNRHHTSSRNSKPDECSHSSSEIFRIIQLKFAYSNYSCQLCIPKICNKWHCFGVKMEIRRDIYLNQLIESRHNNMIKIVTGVRRCGKSYLLFNLFTDWLRGQNIDDKHIIRIDLEDRRNKSLRNPDALLAYIDSHFVDDKMYYILIDEVQLVDEFEDVLNSYLKIKNADVYVTGSNARFLSKDVVTTFRGRGEEIKVYPLSFREFMSVKADRMEIGFEEYMTYGGLPQVLEYTSQEKKSQ